MRRQGAVVANAISLPNRGFGDRTHAAMKLYLTNQYLHMRVSHYAGNRTHTHSYKRFLITDSLIERKVRFLAIQRDPGERLYETHLLYHKNKSEADVLTEYTSLSSSLIRCLDTSKTSPLRDVSLVV